MVDGLRYALHDWTYIQQQPPISITEDTYFQIKTSILTSPLPANGASPGNIYLLRELLFQEFSFVPEPQSRKAFDPGAAR
jgi:hypothetical protein